MKLLSLRIADYHVLHNFVLEFKQADEGQTYALDLIVGVNGTGKSSLLRAVAAIFRYLGRGEMPPFSFEVTYQLTNGSGATTLSNLKENSTEKVEDGLLRLSYGKAQNQPSPDQPIAVERLESSELPPLIVAFTTGSEREWELDAASLPVLNGEQQKPPDSGDAQFKEQLTEWYLRELPGELVNETLEEGQVLATEKFLFITADRMPLVTLCGMLNDMKKALSGAGEVKDFSWDRLQKAMKESGIKLLRGFSLKLRMNRDVLAPEDRHFTDELVKHAHHIVQTGSDYLLVFDLVKAQSKQAGEEAGIQAEQSGQEVFDNKVAQLFESMSIIEFFKRLVGLAQPGGRRDPILRDVDLFLEKEQQEQQENVSQEQADRKPPLHLLRWLSDGEQSFLGRLCLISLLGENEALILLDEPEVHFNDKWKRQLVFMLDQALKGQQSHVLMTTHSSITLTDVPNTSIRLLHRSNGYTSNAISPALRTLGADPSDIMVSVFGAENATGEQGVQLITSKIEEYSKDKNAREKLERLLSEVGPGYWRFLIRREIHALEGEKR